MDEALHAGVKGGVVGECPRALGDVFHLVIPDDTVVAGRVVVDAVGKGSDDHGGESTRKEFLEIGVGGLSMGVQTGDK